MRSDVNIGFGSLLFLSILAPLFSVVFSPKSLLNAQHGYLSQKMRCALRFHLVRYPWSDGRAFGARVNLLSVSSSAERFGRCRVGWVR